MLTSRCSKATGMFEQWFARIENLETEYNDNVNDINNIQNTIALITGDVSGVAEIRSDLDAVMGSAVNIQSQVNTNESVLDTAVSNISAITGSVAVLRADVDDLEDFVSGEFNLSLLNINSDKDWNGYSITNIESVDGVDISSFKALYDAHTHNLSAITIDSDRDMNSISLSNLSTVTANSLVSNALTVQGSSTMRAIVPETNITYALGNTTNYWSGLYTNSVWIGATNVINSSRGIVNITGIVPTTAGGSNIGTSALPFASIYANSNMFMNGTSYLDSARNLSNITSIACGDVNSTGNVSIENNKYLVGHDTAGNHTYLCILNSSNSLVYGWNLGDYASQPSACGIYFGYKTRGTTFNFMSLDSSDVNNTVFRVDSNGNTTAYGTFAYKGSNLYFYDATKAYALNLVRVSGDLTSHDINLFYDLPSGVGTTSNRVIQGYSANITQYSWAHDNAGTNRYLMTLWPSTGQLQVLIGDISASLGNVEAVAGNVIAGNEVRLTKDTAGVIKARDVLQFKDIDSASEAQYIDIVSGAHGIVPTTQHTDAYLTLSRGALNDTWKNGIVINAYGTNSDSNPAWRITTRNTNQNLYFEHYNGTTYSTMMSFNTDKSITVTNGLTVGSLTAVGAILPSGDGATTCGSSAHEFSEIYGVDGWLSGKLYMNNASGGKILSYDTVSIKNMADSAYMGLIALNITANGNINATGNIQVDSSVIIDDYGIVAIPKVVASSNVRFSHDDETSSTATSYTKVKTMTLNTYVTGSIRVYFNFKSGDSNTVYGKLYKNGVAWGTEQTTTSTTYVNKSQDFTSLALVPGDTIELWVHGTSSNTVSARYLRVAFDKTGTGTYTNS